ncbi:MAG: ATP-dependent helicase, partial [Bacteroidetes bacterium]
NLIKNFPEKKMMVFVRTKVRAERVKNAMERVRVASNTIHSDIMQDERERTMQSFRSGDLKILIATDVSARGIDIPNVEYVVNYDMPETLEYYVHRVGRTGRGNQKGQAVSFCSPEEKVLLDEIEKNLGKGIQRIEISKKDYKDTLNFKEEKTDDWKSLIIEAEKDGIQFNHDFSEHKKKKKKKSKQ